MKLKNIFVLLAATVIFSTPSWSLGIPKEAVKYITKQFPQAVIRFDGLVVLPDGTEYLPILPAISQVDAGMQIKTSYPATKDIKTLPDIVVFNNSFGLMKIIYSQDKKASVVQLPDYPIEIKTGMLPQELIVPTGLILPETLQGILGNLEIPLYSISSVIPLSKEQSKKQSLTATTLNMPISNSKFKAHVETMKTTAPDWNMDFDGTLQNKRFLITNLASEYINIVPAKSSDPMFTLKLNTIPLDMAITTDERYLLVTKLNDTNIDIADIEHEEIIKRIDLNVQLNEILVSPDNKTLFVTSLQDSSIFVIDLSSLKVLKKIQVQGMPEKLALSDDLSKLLYFDKMSSKLYCVDLKDRCITTLIDRYDNATKFLFEKDRIYALFRNSGKLNIRKYIPPEYTGSEEAVLKAEEALNQEKLQNKNNNSELMASTDDLAALNKNSSDKNSSRVKRSFREIKYVDKNTVLPLMIEEDIKDEDKGVDIEVGAKPVDMLKYKDLVYILSAKDRVITSIDVTTGKKRSSYKLPVGGFPNKITQVKDSNVAIITNITEGTYVVFDLAGGGVVDVRPLNLPVNDILVIQDK